MSILGAKGQLEAPRSDDPEARSVPALSAADPMGVVRMARDFPLLIGAGEARYFAVECRFEVPPNARFEGTWYSGTLMLDFSTTEGPLRREVPFL